MNWLRIYAKMSASRKRKGQLTANGEADITKIQIPARKTGRSRATGIGTGGELECGVGVVVLVFEIRTNIVYVDRIGHLPPVSI